jgi:hypothetical protein
MAAWEGEYKRGREGSRWGSPGRDGLCLCRELTTEWRRSQKPLGRWSVEAAGCAARSHDGSGMTGKNDRRGLKVD